MPKWPIKSQQLWKYVRMCFAFHTAISSSLVRLYRWSSIQSFDHWMEVSTRYWKGTSFMYSWLQCMFMLIWFTKLECVLLDFVGFVWVSFNASRKIGAYVLRRSCSSNGICVSQTCWKTLRTSIHAIEATSLNSSFLICKFIFLNIRILTCY